MTPSVVDFFFRKLHAAHSVKYSRLRRLASTMQMLSKYECRTKGYRCVTSCTEANVFPLQMRTSQTFLRDTTVVSPLALLLFGGQLEVMHGEGYVLVDRWIRIRAAAPTAVLVQRLRNGLDTLLQQKIKQPGSDWGSQASELINTIIKMLQDEEATRQRER